MEILPKIIFGLLVIGGIGAALAFWYNAQKQDESKGRQEDMKEGINEVDAKIRESLETTTYLKNQKEADAYFNELSYLTKLESELENGYYLVWQKSDGNSYMKAYFKESVDFENLDIKVDMDDTKLVVKQSSKVEPNKISFFDTSFTTNVSINKGLIGVKQKAFVVITHSCPYFILTDIKEGSITYAYGYSKCPD